MPTKKQNENLMTSGRRDKRSILMKKRMLSCATGLQNLSRASAKKQTSSCANGVRTDGKDDICNYRKNGKEEDDWVIDIDSNSKNEGNSEGSSGVYDGPCLPD
jgi:hypothetical protein